MRSRSVALSLLLLGFCIASPTAAAIPVFVKITAGDKPLQDAVATSLKAGLRRLGDVEIVYDEGAADLAIELAVSPVRDPDSGNTIGFALGVTYEAVVMAVNLTSADNLWLEESVKAGCASLDGMKEHFKRASSYRIVLGSWVFYGTSGKINEICARVVRDFDNTFLEVQRSGRLPAR